MGIKKEKIGIRKETKKEQTIKRLKEIIKVVEENNGIEDYIWNQIKDI